MLSCCSQVGSSLSSPGPEASSGLRFSLISGYLPPPTGQLGRGDAAFLVKKCIYSYNRTNFVLKQKVLKVILVNDGYSQDKVNKKKI